MAVTTTSIRLDTQLANEAARILGAKSRTEAVHTALREIVALRRFKKPKKKQAGKLRFVGMDGKFLSTKRLAKDRMTHT